MWPRRSESAPRTGRDARQRARRPAPWGRSLPLALLALLGFVVSTNDPGRDRVAPRTGHYVLTGFGGSSLRSPIDHQELVALPEASATATFKITGSVGGLYPGGASRLRLTVHNQRAFSLIVTSMTTKVEDASAHCPSADLAVGAFSGHLSTPAFGSAVVTVPARLAQKAPNACIGAHFPLIFSGVGEK